MTLSQEYLSAVSAMIIFGQNQEITMYDYYYYSGSIFTTNPPTGVVAILKNSGNIVAKLTGNPTSISTNNAQFIFYDVSDETYNFDEVDIYTENNGVLQYLVSRNTGLNYSKSANEATIIYFTLELKNTVSIYINYSFLYLLVPNLILQNVFPFNNYIGITHFYVAGVEGTVTLAGTRLIPNGFAIFLQLTTTGNGIPIITASTTLPAIPIPTPTPKPTPIPMPIPAPISNPTLAVIPVRNPQGNIHLATFPTPAVFTVVINAQLPSTPNPVTYPLIVGLKYETE